jgi:hypothetical protein
MSSVQRRVVEVAERLLAQDRTVTPIGVLNWLGWLPAPFVDRWRQGREPVLIEQMSTSPAKIEEAMRALDAWARERGLRPAEVEYLSATRDHHPLRFTAGGDEAVERAYRTHWVSSELSEKQVERVAERHSRPPDLVVVQPVKEWTCTQCGGTGDFLIMEGDGPLCLTCAEMDHLIFLPAGNATLSRRARKASRLSAVVVRWSRSRRRYERQGLLVETAALEQAEESTLVEQGGDFPARMAAGIGRLFPGCPPERVEAIARQAGRKAVLDDEAVALAVLASVRHEDTAYDELLMAGVPREEARDRVQATVDRVMTRWRLRVIR